MADHPLIQQMARFSIVGVSATVLDFVLLIVFTDVFHINYLVSGALSFSVSVVVNYVASMRFVFTRKEGMRRRVAFLTFVILSVIGLGLNDWCMWLGVEHLSFDYRIAKVLAALVVSVWNFVSRKLFLEGRDSGEALA